MTSEELLKRYAAGERDFRYANLADADLRGADIRGADISCATLSGANLSSANLSYANISCATLSCATLSGADLSSATLSGANLRGATLAGATLSGAICPDGRTWEDYSSDHLAGLCQTPEIRAKALAAWGGHKWTNCPMHAAHHVNATTGPEMSFWVACYDAGLLARPE